MEPLDPQWLFNGLFTIIGTLGGWLLNNVRDAIRDLQAQDGELTRKVQQFEILVAGSYVTRGELHDLVSKLDTKLDRIETKLDKKVDK